ncbi:RHS repeat-associated core domain-containing protein [Cellulosimicrobium cellulans]|uniref:RHS repeat-associated core domain-containing protein n=1 Tax=Cellulosimicrobium cellulans TaxID=1710 RepID=UPI002406B293|nr:RHS repeat-associated core domain-containing protein [Cellulosimicrobium cellulans]MDF9878676.1 RHS repeat-associated protein [Cellulosimicrobium cellulans]
MTLLGAAPAAGSDEITAAERESWTAEERAAHGQSLWPDRETEALIESEPARPTDRLAAPQTPADSEPAVDWPAPQAVVVDPVDRAADEAQADGRLPVTVVTDEASAQRAGGQDASAFAVQIGEAEAADTAGVEGLLLSVEPENGVTQETGPVEVQVDYSGFADARGGDWASRLRLVALPSCDVVDPEARCAQDLVPLDSANDATTSTVSAVVPAAQMGTLALAASASGSTGDWSATPLAASASWQVSEQTGDFAWSYPMRVPPAASGLEPEVGLNYSSGSIDGRVASTNNQTSWVGDGWDLTSGYVERKYVACADDREGSANNATRETGDLCWKSDNATLVFNGSATELVKDQATGVWKPKSDDGTKVEKLTGAWNTGQSGEHWKVTTTDGTQYFFGRDKRSATDTLALNSAWTVPVFGNHPGEPCYNAAFASASCNQVWRWNLDYVVDPSGNSLTYVYAKETNNYGRNLGTAVSSYVRGGYLARIDYGQRTGAEAANAPARVEFTVAERCLPSGAITCDPAQLTTANASKWPDVPFDLICSSTTSCPNQFSPAFFTRKRLTTVTTKVLNGSAYRNVDSWTLGHQFPDPGDGQDPVLWLASIEHKGLATSSAITLPKTTFLGTQMANRVDTIGDLGPAMNRYRITGINTESGGNTSIKYTAIDCTTTSLPATAETNTRRCFPVYWDPEGSIGLTQEYFHKYLVSSISDTGRDDKSTPVITDYTYVGGAAWHYDDNELVQPKYRTWGQFRGYATVDVVTGASGNPDYPQLKTRYRFFRGMHGDRSTPAGGTKTVAVDGITDHDHFNGFTREEITYNGAAEVTGTLTTPWASDPTATGANGLTARHTGVGTSETRTTAPALAGGKRTTRTVTTHGDYGMPVQVEDQGDTATATDDRCTRITYARNATKHILSTVSRTETVAKACATTPARPGDVISDARTAYDGLAVGAAPTSGLATQSQELKAYSGTTPQYVTTATNTYDALGRVTKVTDALGRATTTAYTPAGAGPVTKTVLTGPDPDGTGPLTAHVTTTDLDPAWGTPTKTTDPNGKITSGSYDALGRLTGVWKPGRVQGTDTAHTTFGYTISATGQNAVTTKNLIHDGTYTTSVVLYDGLLRERQTQTPTGDRDTPGRLVTDKHYDSRGLPTLTTRPWATTGEPATIPVLPTNALLAQTLTSYDGAGRAVAEIFQTHDHEERWRTTTTYGGDRVSVDPPTGGTPTTTITDARGQTTQLLQYTGPAPTGAHQATTYTWDKAGRLASMTDPAGNQWTYTYDLRGRQTGATDPDKGASTSTYDDAGQLLTSTDARGITLASVYDLLGRKTQLREGSATGTVRASWAYDTLAKGQLTSSTRNDGTAAYVTAITGYDDGYRPLGTSVTLPSAAGALAGTYTTNYTYTLDGQLRQTKYPAAGGMSAETVTTDYDSRSMPERTGGGLGWGSYVSNTQYSVYGEPLVTDLGSGYSQMLNHSYEDDTRRPARTWLQREGQTSLDLDVRYTYDDAGNITSIADTPGTRAADVQCFAYDGLRRLTEAWTPSTTSCATTGRTTVNLGGAAAYWTSYTFDAVGNRTTTTTHATVGNTTDTYTYPAAGTARPHAVSKVVATGASTGTNTYAYDAAGNTTNRNLAGEPAQTLTWDAEGKLDTLTEAGAVKGDYIYTAGGDRLLRKEGNTTTAYLPGFELTATGTTTTVTRYYTFGGQTIATRTKTGASGVNTLVADHHGTAEIAINNGTNQPTRRYHDPYGNARGTTTPWVDDKGFLGKPTDTTGLTHIGARYYDPQVGRFISADPIVDLTDPQQWQSYAYANNTPVTTSDPTGLLGVRTIPGGYAHSGIIRTAASNASPAVQETIARVVTRGTAERERKRTVEKKLDSYNPMNWQRNFTIRHPEIAELTGADLAADCNDGLGGCEEALFWAAAGVFGFGSGKLFKQIFRKILGRSASIGGRSLRAAALATQRTTIDPKKFDYLFGYVTGPHNGPRSRQNARQLASIGVHDNDLGRALIADHLDMAAHGESNILRKYSDQYGDFEIRESLFLGPNGALKIESTWEITEAGPKLTTVIPYGEGTRFRFGFGDGTT